MKITLTQGQFALVDDADFGALSKYKWFAYWNRDTRSFYARRNSRLPSGKATVIGMHRQILGLTDPKIKADHKNHDTLDNQCQNLRAVTNSQNLMNRRGARRGSATGVRGVTKNNYGFVVRIQIGAERHYLGNFPIIAEAAAVYAAANRKHYGEFGGGL